MANAASKPPAWNQIRSDASTFAARWSGETDENAGAQAFWTEFLGIFGVDRKRVATFEARAQRTTTGGRGRIDLFWPGVMAVEHKSAGKDLAAAEQQCLDYLDGMDSAQFPGWVVTSDFARIRIRDLGGDNVPYEFALTDLPKEIDRFGFIAGYSTRKLATDREHQADIAAAQLMGSLYEQIADTGFSEHEVSIFLVRLLFLLFGDDTGLWERGLFLEFVETRTTADGSDLGPQLTALFQTLDKPTEHRSPALDDLLARFPYVNGGLFRDRLDIPSFNKAIRDTLLAACYFDWSAIVPAIFGSLFQAVKSKEDRRALGEHYTSERNILKVIRPLFLDDFREQYEKGYHDVRLLERLRTRLGELKFLDPACGCGNFLVIAYREMRLLELDILKRLRDLTGHDQLSLDATLGLKVSPAQFYGIEFEEWPARIAEVAMFLVDHQMNLALAREFGQAPDRLPISTTATIVNGNALTIAWDEVVPGMDANTRIGGNPPFLGSLMLSEEQKADARHVWGDNKRLGTMDYVTNWFVLGARLAARYGCDVGFVSTNSITQGEQVAALWAELKKSGVQVPFAHQTFSWSNEAAGQAAVHVVVMGLSARERSSARLYTYDDVKGEAHEVEVPSINAYLTPGPIVLVSTRLTPLNPGQTQMRFGSMPRDGGFLSKISMSEADAIRENDPIAAKYLRRLYGADELLNGKERWCLWLVDAEPIDLRASAVLRERLNLVREMRLASKAASTRRFAETPALFAQIGQPTTNYIAVPAITTQARRYVPVVLLTPDIIVNNKIYTLSNTDMLTFGLISSSAFNEWNRTVSGRMKSDFSISAEITWHNFPYPADVEKHRAAIESAAQAVLDARAAHPNSTLADLYDPLATPKDLLDAHRALDRAVLTAYRLPADADSTAILAKLFDRYVALDTEGALFDASAPKKATRRRKT